MSLNFTPEQWAEVFDHLRAIDASKKSIRDDIKEIAACFDRIDAMFDKSARPYGAKE
jgi:hypothetical protein